MPLICNINIACAAQTRYSGTQNITGDTFAGGNRLREIRNTTTGNSANIITLNIQNGSNIANAVDFVNTTTNFSAGNWAAFTQDRPALDVHWGIESVLDYWATVHNRNSIDGLGIQATSFVHFNDPSSNAGWPNNAQWNSTGLAMRFGDGDGTTFNPLVSLDITAHELGHGINQFTANLTTGVNESGALNEGFSDIWAASIENWATTNKQTWLIGEEIFATSSFTCIRNMQNPKSSTAAEGKHPDTYQGQFWDSNGEPHNNSTILSHWFYLLSQGGIGTNDNNNNYNVSGIGIGNAQRIAFRTLAIYLVSNSGYSDARTQTINATRDLFCDNSKEMAAVTNAWRAVGVGNAFSGTLPSISGNDPICATQNFTLQNQISGTTFSWSSGNISQMSVSPQSSATTTASRLNSYNGAVDLNITFIGAASCTTTITRAVQVGAFNTGQVIVTGQPGVCNGNNYVYSAIVPGGHKTGYTYAWTKPANWTLNYQSANTISYYVPQYNPNYGTVRVSVYNGCGTTPHTGITVYPGSGCSGGGYYFTIFPNPSTALITVELVQENAEVVADSEKEFRDLVYSIELVNDNGKKMLTETSKSKIISFETVNFPKGLYFLNIILKNEIITERVLIK